MIDIYADIDDAVGSIDEHLVLVESMKGTTQETSTCRDTVQKLSTLKNIRENIDENLTQSKAVADLGFPVGGRGLPRWLRFHKICMSKRKNRVRPPGSANAKCTEYNAEEQGEIPRGDVTSQKWGDKLAAPSRRRYSARNCFTFHV